MIGVIMLKEWRDQTVVLYSAVFEEEMTSLKPHTRVMAPYILQPLQQIECRILHVLDSPLGHLSSTDEADFRKTVAAALGGARHGSVSGN